MYHRILLALLLLAAPASAGELDFRTDTGGDVDAILCTAAGAPGGHIACAGALDIVWVRNPHTTAFANLGTWPCDAVDGNQCEIIDSLRCDEDTIGTDGGAICMYDGDSAQWVEVVSEASYAPCNDGVPLVKTTEGVGCATVVLTTDLGDSQFTGPIGLEDFPDATLPGIPLLSGGAGTGGTLDPAFGIPSLASGWDVRDEFCSGGATTLNIGQLAWALGVSGGTAAIVSGYAIDSGWGVSAGPCWLKLAGGTGATGYSSVVQAADSFHLTGGEAYRTTVALDALSDGTDTYIAVAGVSTNTTAAPAGSAEGIYFLYDTGAVASGSLSSANWQLCSSDGVAGAAVCVDSTVPVVAKTTAPARLSWTLSAARAITGNVNGTSFTGPTEVPTTAMPMRAGYLLLRSAGTTNDRALYVDYMQYSKVLTTAR